MAYYGKEYDRPLQGDGYQGSRGPGYGGGYRPWAPGTTGYDYGYRSGAYRYGGDFGPASRGGYDRNYKSRWQTDYGDPFGDRGRGTPFRAMRGEFEGRGRNYGPGAGYDRGYHGAYPARGRYDRGWQW